jgi:acetyltransferase-like isoleucine patch superfamily enzyme
MNKDKFIKVGRCKIDKGVLIHAGSVIGKPYRRDLDGHTEQAGGTVIKKGVYIGYFCLVGAKSIIGASSILDDRSSVESNVTLGSRNLLIYSAHLCSDVRIGSDCIIGGFIGDRTIIGSHCRIFGNIVHQQQNPTAPWDAESSMEPSAKIHDYVFAGFNSVISGPVSIGPRAYILPGALITKDVPAYHIASGINCVVHHSRWKGSLSKSPIFCK